MQELTDRQTDCHCLRRTYSYSPSSEPTACSQLVKKTK